jgi:hypothetical protein
VGGIDWVDLAHDRDRSEILVNAVMNLWVMVYVTSDNSGKMYSSGVGLSIFSKCTMYKQT